METKAEVKSYFNEAKWKKIQSECPELLSGVKDIFELWQKEPLLQPIPFGKDHFDNLLVEKAGYITRIIKEHVSSVMEKLSPGMGALVTEPVLKIDLERLSRQIEMITSPRFRLYVHQQHISFDKVGRPYISDPTLKELKASCMVELTATTSDVLSKAMKIETLSEELFELIKAKKVEESRKSALPFAGSITLISRAGEGKNSPLIIDSMGQIKFNSSFM